MGNRLHVQFTVLLDMQKDKDGSIQETIKRAMREGDNQGRAGLLSIEYREAANFPYSRLDADRHSKDRDDVDFKWLDVRSSFTNYEKQFQAFWETVRPIMCSYAGAKAPVGFWFDDSEQGLIYLDDPLWVKPK